MNKHVKILLCHLGHFVLSTLAAAAILGIMLGVTYADLSIKGCIPENSYTEALQEILLLCCAGVFAYLTLKCKSKGLWLVTGFFLTMFIREWDGVFDRLFHGAWKFFAFPNAVLFIFLACRNGMEKVYADLAEFVQAKPFFLLELGLILVLALSRIIGMREIVTLFAGTHLPVGLKNFLEEGTELAGYLVLFLASMRYIVEYKRLYAKK